MFTITYKSLHTLLMSESLAHRYFSHAPSRERKEKSGRLLEITGSREALLRPRYEASLRYAIAQIRGWVSEACYGSEGVDISLTRSARGVTPDVEDALRRFVVYDVMHSIVSTPYYIERRDDTMWMLLALLKSK